MGKNEDKKKSTHFNSVYYDCFIILTLFLYHCHYHDHFSFLLIKQLRSPTLFSRRCFWPLLFSLAPESTYFCPIQTPSLPRGILSLSFLSLWKASLNIHWLSSLDYLAPSTQHTGPAWIPTAASPCLCVYRNRSIFSLSLSQTHTHTLTHSIFSPYVTRVWTVRLLKPAL